MLRALALRTAFLGSEMLFRQLGCVNAARTRAVPLRQLWASTKGTVQQHSPPLMLRSGRALQARHLHPRQVVAALGTGVAEESPEPGDHRGTLVAYVSWLHAYTTQTTVSLNSPSKDGILKILRTAWSFT